MKHTGKNEYILDSKHDNKSENPKIFTDANKTKVYDGNKNVSLKYDSLSYERDNKLQIGGELGVTYRQPMGEGLLVGGYVGVSYNFDNEYSYNFKAKGTGDGEQSAEDAFKAVVENKRVDTTCGSLIPNLVTKDAALKFADNKTIAYSNIAAKDDQP